MHRGQHHVRGGERVTIAHGRKGKGYSLLIWQEQHGSAHLRKLARARKMIGMDVRVEDAGNLPTVAPRQVEVVLRIKRGINHHSLLACANEIGEAAFSGAPHLDDTDVARVYG